MTIDCIVCKRADMQDLLTHGYISYNVCVAALLHGVRPPLHLHTVLAPRRRTVSLVAPPVVAPSMGLSSETDAVPPTTAPRPRLHCPTIQGLLLSNEGAPLLVSSARSPPSLSAGQWRHLTVHIGCAPLRYLQSLWQLMWDKYWNCKHLLESLNSLKFLWNKKTDCSTLYCLYTYVPLLMKLKGWLLFSFLCLCMLSEC